MESPEQNFKPEIKSGEPIADMFFEGVYDLYALGAMSVKELKKELKHWEGRLGEDELAKCTVNDLKEEIKKREKL